MTEIVPASMAAVAFDYSALDAEGAELAQRTTEKFHQPVRRTSAEMIEVGLDLIRVKERLKSTVGHGHFVNWLEAELGCTVRMAQLYMRAGEVFGEKRNAVSHLPER